VAGDPDFDPLLTARLTDGLRARTYLYGLASFLSHRSRVLSPCLKVQLPYQEQVMSMSTANKKDPKVPRLGRMEKRDVSAADDRRRQPQRRVCWQGTCFVAKRVLFCAVLAAAVHCSRQEEVIPLLENRSQPTGIRACLLPEPSHRSRFGRASGQARPYPPLHPRPSSPHPPPLSVLRSPRRRWRRWRSPLKMRSQADAWRSWKLRRCAPSYLCLGLFGEPAAPKWTTPPRKFSMST